MLVTTDNKTKLIITTSDRVSIFTSAKAKKQQIMKNARGAKLKDDQG